MRVPVIVHKPGACFPIIDNRIKVYAYEVDEEGTVTRAQLLTIHVNSKLSKLREMYATRWNLFPHDIEMFYDDKEVFEDETCRSAGIQHEGIVLMQIVEDNIEYSKLQEEGGEDNSSPSSI